MGKNQDPGSGINIPIRNTGFYHKSTDEKPMGMRGKKAQLRSRINLMPIRIRTQHVKKYS
jgi:hypothetical protein